jgi:UDPglucose--hexose-1-phosphate uridylyltransferase
MSDRFNASEHPHRRRNALNGRSVLVSPQRARRPWLGQHDVADIAPRLAHDPACFLCPGNTRAAAAVNPPYRGSFVFANDFGALQTNTPSPPSEDALLHSAPARGECHVLCFSPDHALTLPELPLAAVEDVVHRWCEMSAELGQRWPWVQVFENKGAMMGCSNPHPHGQVWATNSVPDEVQAEDLQQRAWFAAHKQALLHDYLQRELQAQERLVCSNADWVALVPWWASWPFETLLLPRAPLARLPELNKAQRHSLAQIVQALTTRYDNLFACSFPYSMGWHGAPFDAGSHPTDTAPWRLHAHFYPPLLRSAEVRKFMVGYELLCEAQRDLTPEQAAAALRAVFSVHYRRAAAP